MELADRIVVMQSGRLEQFAAPGSLYRNPQTLGVAQFIGAMNTCTTRVSATEALWYGLPLHLALPDGEAALLCRPEDLCLDRAGAKARVTRVIDLGPVTKVSLMTAGGDLVTLTCPRDAAPDVDTAIAFLPRRLHAFRDGALLALPDRPEPALRNGAFA